MNITRTKIIRLFIPLINFVLLIGAFVFAIFYIPYTMIRK
jgi:hypothetical protein